MIVRYAFFEGTIRDGKEKEFYKFVDDKLVPLWTQFEGASEVRTYAERERDEGAPGFPLIMAIVYPDRWALDRAMACEARFKSRDETMNLMKMFDGRIHHHVTEAAIHPAT